MDRIQCHGPPSTYESRISYSADEYVFFEKVGLFLTARIRRNATHRTDWSADAHRAWSDQNFDPSRVWAFAELVDCVFGVDGLKLKNL